MHPNDIPCDHSQLLNQEILIDQFYLMYRQKRTGFVVFVVHACDKTDGLHQRFHEFLQEFELAPGVKLQQSTQCTLIPNSRQQKERWLIFLNDSHYKSIQSHPTYCLQLFCDSFLPCLCRQGDLVDDIPDGSQYN